MGIYGFAGPGCFAVFFVPWQPWARFHSEHYLTHPIKKLVDNRAFLAQWPKAS